MEMKFKDFFFIFLTLVAISFGGVDPFGQFG